MCRCLSSAVVQLSTSGWHSLGDCSVYVKHLSLSCVYILVCVCMSVYMSIYLHYVYMCIDI